MRSPTRTAAFDSVSFATAAAASIGAKPSSVSPRRLGQGSPVCRTSSASAFGAGETKSGASPRVLAKARSFSPSSIVRNGEARSNASGWSASTSASDASASETGASSRPAAPRIIAPGARSPRLTGWNAKRPTSHIHQPFTSRFSRGRKRLTSPPRSTSTVVEQPRLHSPQVEAIFKRFQTRAWKRNSFSVSAPTGHRSAMFPW